MKAGHWGCLLAAVMASWLVGRTGNQKVEKKEEQRVG